MRESEEGGNRLCLLENRNYAENISCNNNLTERTKMKMLSFVPFVLYFFMC